MDGLLSSRKALERQMMSASPSAPAAARPYHHGNLRQAILVAALDVLAQEEPSALSLRDLARTVGVRHSALYTHFKDRTHLLAVIAGEGFRALLKAMLAMSDTSRGRVAALAGAYVRFARQNPAYYRVMFMPEVGRPENNADFREVCQACFTTLAQAIGESARVSDEEVHERAVAIWSTLHGLVALGENAGPLYGQISPDREVPMASRIATVLAFGPWPPG